MRLDWTWFECFMIFNMSSTKSQRIILILRKLLSLVFKDFPYYFKSVLEYLLSSKSPSDNDPAILQIYSYIYCDMRRWRGKTVYFSLPVFLLFTFPPTTKSFIIPYRFGQDIVRPTTHTLKSKTENTSVLLWCHVSRWRQNCECGSHVWDQDPIVIIKIILTANIQLQ